jgi:hypothetical protein
MFYDAYKLGFAYYCDQNVISYDILNSCAMKYVIAYRCFDFFIDEYILPENSKNPLKHHYLDESTGEKNNKSISSLFVKSRQNNILENNSENDNNKLRNKFIYLGNIRNFTPCLKEKKNILGFASILLDGIDNSLSWNSYKKK